jgi:phosphatidate phosphatase APP1
MAINQLLAACQQDIRRYAQRNCLISDVDDAIQESLLSEGNRSRLVLSVRVLGPGQGMRLFLIVLDKLIGNRVDIRNRRN